MYENYTEKREECDNRSNNSWLPLEKNGELGRDEKNIAFWTGFNASTFLSKSMPRYTAKAGIKHQSINQSKSTPMVFNVQRMWHSPSNFQRHKATDFFYL